MNEAANDIITHDKSWDGFIAKNNAFIVANPHLLRANQVCYDWVESICKASKDNHTALKNA